MRIVVLSGAGLSAESGLATFRDAGGIWSQVSLEEVATPEGYAADPAKVLAFYNARRRQAAAAEPNAAHHALAQLEASPVHAVTLVTQNVDSLLRRAGAVDPVHMHGQLDRALCAACGARSDATDDQTLDDVCDACGATGTLRPDVVWFGEMPYRMEEIEAALARCDVFAAVGTSGQVYPAAGFVELARAAGAQTLEVTLEPSGNPAFDDVRAGPATQTVPRMVDALLSGRAP